MGPRWPLQVGSCELIPVDLDAAWSNKVHLTRRALPGEDAAALLDDFNDGQWTGSEDDSAMDAWVASGWRTRTLCATARPDGDRPGA
jgi:hypothetical protein